MKQNKIVKVLLLVALSLAIALTFVACNKDNKTNDPIKNTSSDNDTLPEFELSDDMKQLIETSRDDLDHMLNYFLTLCESLNDDQQVNMALTWTNKYVGCRAFLSNDGDYYYAEPSNKIDIFIFENEEDAIEFADDAGNETWLEDSLRIGNKLISNNTLYQQIADIERPTTITKFNKEQMEFIDEKLHRGVDKEERFICTEIGASGEYPIGHMWCYNEMLSGNCCTKEAILIDNDDERIAQDKKFLSINYTDDSYVKTDETTGLTYLKLTDKPGWHIGETYVNGQPAGKYHAEYYYSIAPTTLIVPAKIGGYDIDVAGFETYNDETIESVIIEKPLNEVILCGKIKQITIPISDSAFVTLAKYCTSNGTSTTWNELGSWGNSINSALETINFGGTTQQWEELYDENAMLWTKLNLEYNYEKGEFVYDTITFTVVCTNGSITYPKTNA